MSPGRQSSTIGQMNGDYKTSITLHKKIMVQIDLVQTTEDYLITSNQLTYPIHGVNSDGPTIHCTGIVHVPAWKSDNGQVL